MIAEVKAWYFAPDDMRLANGDNRPIVVGESLTVEGPLVLCEHGLHASRRAIDALGFATSNVVTRVLCCGDILEAEDGDKLCCTERYTVAAADAEQVLRAWSRWCALEVAHLWDMPDVVRQYLETGDESIGDAARNALKDVAWDAVTAVARDTAWCAVRAACSASWATAKATAREAAEATKWAVTIASGRAAAKAAARAAFIERANEKLEAMLLELLGCD